MPSMHKGMDLFPQGGSVAEQIRRIVLAANRPYDDNGPSQPQVDAKWAWVKDVGGTVRKWARACPDPASSDVTVTLYENPGTNSPTSNDGILKFHVNAAPSNSGQFTVSWAFVVQYYNDDPGTHPDPGGRTSGTVLTLGTDYTWSGSVLSITSDWVVPHQAAPYGSYTITPKATRTFDTTIPSPEFDDYQLTSNQVTGTAYNYVDPRADQ